VGGRSPNWRSRAATGRVSPALLTLALSASIGHFANTCLPTAVNRKAKEFRSRFVWLLVRNRLRDIGEARFQIQKYLSNPAGAMEVPQLVRGQLFRLPWMIASAVCLIALSVLGFVFFRHVTEEQPRLVKLSVLPPEKATIKADSLLAVSPDGRRLAFAARGARRACDSRRDRRNLAGDSAAGSKTSKFELRDTAEGGRKT
jgi:hypothetical protein